MRRVSNVVLVDVDATTLEQLVTAAVGDAAAADVTPPLDGDERWSTQRIEWLRSFHRDRAVGLDGPEREATWAVVADGAVVGSIRLKQLSEPGVFETGVWLTRSARGQGVGRRAVAAVLPVAAALGAQTVVATTQSGNPAALSVLSRLGFTLSVNPKNSLVHACITPPSQP
jgi:RimJ/RimL family protein N-acetyltransferase